MANLQIFAKPFLKWAGGKSQLLTQFINYYPEELKNGTIKNYYEPFLGSGAVFFSIAQKYHIQNSFLFDINEDLILAYKVVQKNVELLIDFLENFENEFLEKNIIFRDTYYYNMREIFNNTKSNLNYHSFSSDWILRTAQLIFLNKTCYNGLYRTNKKGEFNVPFGRYKKPKIFDQTNLRNISKLLDSTELRVADFGVLEKEIKENSFVYFDPPYRPINKTSNFTAYNKSIFDDNEQIRLANIFKTLNDKNIKLMLSNSDPKNFNQDDNFFEEKYAGFKINRLDANRMINNIGTKRGKIVELLITNY